MLHLSASRGLNGLQAMVERATGGAHRKRFQRRDLKVPPGREALSPITRPSLSAKIAWPHHV